MLKYTLYVANDTNNLEHALAAQYGGVTATRGRGIWSDGDKRYDEAVNVLVVFADGSILEPSRNFDEYVAQHTTERAYVLETPTGAEIRFVEYLR